MDFGQLEKIAKQFLEDGKFTLRNALAYAGLGLSKATGDINAITSGVAFNGYPYTSERKGVIEESVGELMFYMQILLDSCGSSFSTALQKYINLFLIKNKQLTKEMSASILELMKHVKDVNVHDTKELIDKLSQLQLDKEKTNVISRSE